MTDTPERLAEERHLELLMATLLPLCPSRTGPGIAAGGIEANRVAFARAAAKSLVEQNRELAEVESGRREVAAAVAKVKAAKAPAKKRTRRKKDA